MSIFGKNHALRHMFDPAQCQSTVVNSVNDLGVLLDSQLTMADHVAALCRSVSFSYVS